MSAADTRTLWVPGKPSSQSMPRKGQDGHFYREDSGWQAQVYVAWYNEHGTAPLEGMVAVELKFILKGGHTGALITVRPVEASESQLYHQGRNDLDKLVAAILDALSGHVLGGKRLPPLAYKDDRQVVRLSAQKVLQ